MMRVKVIRRIVSHDLHQDNWSEHEPGDELDVVIKHHKGKKEIVDLLLTNSIAENCSPDSFEIISDEPFTSNYILTWQNQKKWRKEDRELSIWDEDEDEIWDEEEDEEEGVYNEW